MKDEKISRAQEMVRRVYMSYDDPPSMSHKLTEDLLQAIVMDLCDVQVKWGSMSTPFLLASIHMFDAELRNRADAIDLAIEQQLLKRMTCVSVPASEAVLRTRDEFRKEQGL